MSQRSPTLWASWLVWSPPLLAGLWLVATSIGEPLAALGVYDSKRVLQLGLLLAVILAAVASFELRSGMAKVLAAAPVATVPMLVAFFALGVASALRLEHPGYSLADVSLFFLLMVGALAMAGCRVILGDVFNRILLTSFALMGVGVFALEMAGQAAYLGSGLQYSYSESLIRFAHPRMYNHVQTWTVPLLTLLPLAFPRQRAMNWLVFVLLGSQWYILISTGARGSVVALVTASLLALALAPHASGRHLRAQITGVALGAGLYFGAVQLLQAIQPDIDTFVQQSVGRELLTTTGRTGLWHQAWVHFLAHPWLGTGPAFYACDAPYYTAASPHNVPLQFLSEWGLPAFLLLGALVLRLAWRVVSDLRATDQSVEPAAEVRDTRYALAVACLAVGVDALVSGLVNPPASQVTGMLVLGWLWGELAAGHRPGSTSAPAPRVAMVLAASALVVVVTLISFARTEREVLQERTAYAQDYGNSTPRFWRDGRTCFYDYSSSQKKPSQ